MTTTEGIQYHEQKARPYQAILEEIASSKNTIIHLPTGSGKTFIAQRLIKKFRNQLKKPWGEGGKRSFFLVNTVPLVNQQKNVIEMMCPVDGVGAYSSEDGVDYWKKADWDSELARNQVIVMTSQILSDMLTHAYIRIEDINLIIFDECHHAVEDHPMRVIMKHFLNCKAHEQPRVLGLTATLLNGNVSISKIEETLKQLENTFHATIATVDDLGEVMTYSTNPQEFIQYFRKPQMSEAAKEAISLLNTLQNLVMSVKLPVSLPSKDFKKTPCQRDISNDPNKIVKAVKNLIVGMITNLEEMGLYGGSLGILAYIVLLERLKRKASTKEENLLYSTVITHSTEARMILLDAMENETGYDKIIKHSSEKILQLIDLLKEYNPLILEKPGELLKVNHSRKPLCGIIFTKQRFTSKILYNILMDLKKARPDEFEFLKHDFVVGFSINPFKSTREEHYLKKSSQKAILGFNNGDLNCLISTSVIEEGLDIPQCALVVRYDAPTEYRSYIQSKGRARSSEASFVILVDIEDKQSFLIKYDAFQKTEERIRNLIVGDDSRAAPTTQDIHENLYDDDEVPPYETSNGNILYSVSAISLLSRYCSILPHDQFTTITPVWLQEVVENGAKKQVTVILPIGSPVKEEIKGDPYSNTKTAKRSAALKACIKLHELGELHPLTLLPYKYAEVDYERDDIRGCFPNWTKDCETEIKENVPKPGSKKRKRKHKIQFPSHLDAVPDSSVFYLHVIKMEAAFEKPNDNREKALYDFIKRNECYGFLTQKPLPKLCEFPAFTSVGEITTSIEVNYAVIKLTPIIFELVKQFHYFLFDQILAINKKFLIFEGTKNCMYVVPVLEHNGYNIDWATMQTHHTVPPVAAPSVEERKSLVVTEENYTNCIVTPWYRGTILPERYVVTKVLEYMTPKSQFDADCYESYANYYANKYNLDILGSESQPLLEVRNISTRMNCLLPRAATLKAFTDKQLKMISIAFGDDKPKGFAEIFIPEFCIKYDYPGVLWYKATLLPSIIHRVHMLLVAHELLVEISNATKYGQPILKKTESFQPIQVDRYIAINSLLSQVEEPLHVHTIDRIHKGTDDCLKKVVPLKKSLYKLQRKKIDKEYPWDQRIEPIDVERNLSTITLMDIECYDEFVSAPISSASNNPCSPPRIVPKAPAIAPPPIKYVDKIEILKKTPTGRGPELRDVLAALTTINSNDTFDLERPETLGDSFLKFAASLYLHHKFPNMNEGQLTNIKGKLISNRNLYYAGAKFNLGGRMKVEQFSPRSDFLVPGFFAPPKLEEFIEQRQIRPTFLIGIQFTEEEVMTGELSEESWESVMNNFQNGIAEAEPEGCAQNSMQCYVHSQAVADKSIADSVEALIGTYLLSGGILAAVKLLEWMEVFPPQDNFADMLHKPVQTPLSKNLATEADIDFLLNNSRTDVEKILNYTFKDSTFLLNALSHSSYIRNRLTSSYERLEFLGDAIIDFLVTSHIFENCRELKPGEMTDLRSALVNNVTFAAYTVKLGLHKYLCSELNPSLEKAIMKFVEHQIERNHEIEFDVLLLISEVDCQVAEYVDVPKVLSDIFEALVGAVYLDSCGNLETVWSVLYKIMHVEIDSFSKRIPKQPVKILYEMIHACPVFEKQIVVNPDIPKVMVPVSFTKNDQRLAAYGVGVNKSQAKRAAAKLALKILDS